MVRHCQGPELCSSRSAENSSSWFRADGWRRTTHSFFTHTHLNTQLTNSLNHSLTYIDAPFRFGDRACWSRHHPRSSLSPQKTDPRAQLRAYGRPPDGAVLGTRWCGLWLWMHTHAQAHIHMHISKHIHTHEHAHVREGMSWWRRGVRDKLS